MLLKRSVPTICLLFSCTLLARYSTASVELTQSFSPTGNILLKCSAHGPSASSSSIRLGCTLAENEICRENCTRTCLIVDGVPDCSQITSDSVVSCKYFELSFDNIEVIYELSKHSIPPNVHWWCNFRDEKSTRFGSNHLEGSFVKLGEEAYHESKRVSLKSLPSLSGPRDDKKKPPGNLFSLEIIFFIALCTALSCLLNVFLFLRCHFIRKYIKKLSRGGRSNERIESSLCIRKLAKTYKNRKHFKRPYIESMLNRKGVPMTDPIQRRPFNHINLPMRSGSLQQCVFQPLTTDTIYDDVPASSFGRAENDVRNRQKSKENGLNTTPCPARKCIVDQDGTVYVALGQVADESTSHDGSRSTLVWANELQPSVKIQKHFRSSTGRLQQRSPATMLRLNRQPNLSGKNSGLSTPLQEHRNEVPHHKSANSGYPGIPPVYPHTGQEFTRNEQIRSDMSTNNQTGKVFMRPTEHVKSNLSCLSPPTLFSDRYPGDIEEEDEKFYRDVDTFFDTVVNEGNPDVFEVPIPRDHVKQGNNLADERKAAETQSLY